ncbi:MAG: alanine dehydrogenase [Bacteroidales bacterium]|nr:alanine dehydrogenase [Bacteroidales bacterium]
MGTITSQFTFGNVGLLPQEEKLELQTEKKRLTIGLPSETDENESRIALTPQAVEILVKNKYTIIVESGAGKRANYTDMMYSEAGAIITETKAEAYQCDILLKVAPFNPDEIALVKPRQTIISSFIVNEQGEESIKGLIQKKVNAVGFEYMKELNGNYPVVRSLCEIAGNISIMVAAEYLSTANSGKGVLLGGVTGISPTEVVILGANTAGEFATRTALGMGATVKIFDDYLHRLTELQQHLGQRIFTSNFHPKVLKKALSSAEIVIGAIQLVEQDNAFFVTEDLVKAMKPGSIIIDLSIDQGGCFETSRCTTHKKPIYKKHGVIHYCVPNITSRVARTSSIALSNIFLPILLRMGEVGGFSSYLKHDFTTRQGVYLYNGILTNSYISKYFNIPYKNIDLLMAAF